MALASIVLSQQTGRDLAFDVQPAARDDAPEDGYPERTDADSLVADRASSVFDFGALRSRSEPYRAFPVSGACYLLFINGLLR
jgi:hypothetical protein